MLLNIKNNFFLLFFLIIDIRRDILQMEKSIRFFCFLSTEDNQISQDLFKEYFCVFCAFVCSAFVFSSFFFVYSFLGQQRCASSFFFSIITRNEPFVRILALSVHIQCVRMLIISFLLCSLSLSFSFTNGGLMNVFFLSFLKVYIYIFCLLLPSTLSSTEKN